MGLPRLVLAAVAVALAPLAWMAVPAGAITHGDLDGNAHQYVGLLVTRDENGFGRCSGMLVSATVFVTAGHCTEGDPHVEIWFEEGPIDGDPAYPGTGADHCVGVAGYPCHGDVSGTPYTYPGYDPDAPERGDLGVVVLDHPVTMDHYAELPEQDVLDRGRKTTFTAVGYGQQKASKSGRKDVAIRVRMVAHPKLKEINGGSVGDYGVLFSGNANTGGVCFGDSGGPLFLGDSTVLAGVIAYATKDNCKGKGGGYRVDRSGPLDWLEQQLGS